MASKNEKSATLILLEYLAEVDRRKLYSEKAYASLFEYVMSDLGYSESQTADRVNAVRLMKSVPEVKKHLEEGSLSLTTISQIQRYVAAESKAVKESGGKYSDAVSAETKEAVVNACLNLSKRDVERKLLSQMSEAGRVVLQEKVRAISDDRTELRFSVNAHALKKLERLKELLGNESLEKIFERALDALVIKEEAKRGVNQKVKSHASGDDESHSNEHHSNRFHNSRHQNSTSNSSTSHSSRPDRDRSQFSDTVRIQVSSTLPAKFTKKTEYSTASGDQSRYIPMDWRRELFKRSGGQCEFKNIDQKRCQSRYRLHIDHIQPLARGGKTELQNLRHLCAQHNQLSARNWNLHPPRSN